ncbi:hypothetical protein Chor_007424 [Crotalus horridus]
MAAGAGSGSGSGTAGAASVASLWSEVNRCGQNGDFGRALKSVNKILQISKDDVTALHCKVVCLIQNGSFKEALSVIHTHVKVLTSDLIAFEKAYCEYRLNRIENALKTIEGASQQTNKLKELYGQVLYRLERYDDCLAVYRDLIRNSQDDYEEERKTNLSAVVGAQSTWEKVVPEDLGLKEATYELCYNAACALIGQGRLNEAMKTLQKAEDLCRQSLSEDSDVTEEDVEAELAIIHGQMAYILQLQGHTEEALQLYNQIIKLKPTDVGLLAVIANNIITINKADQCRKLAAGLQSQSPEHLLPVLIHAAQLCREKQHTKAIELLQEFADQHPEKASEIKLTMAQLKVAQGSVTKACIILRTIDELRHKPGMPKSPVLLSLIREAANFKLKHGRKKEAISDLEELWKQNPDDVHTLAQLISAYSLVDAEKAKIQGDVKKKRRKKKDLEFSTDEIVRDASKTASSPPTSPRPGTITAIPSASTSNMIPPRHQKPPGAAATKKKQQQKKKKGGKGGW